MLQALPILLLKTSLVGKSRRPIWLLCVMVLAFQ